MQTRELFHGTNGDNILRIIAGGKLIPGDGKIFFSERRADLVLMHGPDTKRKATFAIKLRVDISQEAALQKTATSGVADTLIVNTTHAIPATVLELYVRAPRSSTLKIIKGSSAIRQYLSASPFVV